MRASTMHALVALALAGGCTKATSTSDDDRTNPRVEERTGERTGVAPRPSPAATVTLTSVLFADDCGATAPATPPAPPPAPLKKSASPAAVAAPRDIGAAEAADSLVARRCEQTSMQLAITASRDTEVRIVSVEVFDEAGAALGALTPSHPTRWADDTAAYAAWDQRVRADETARVSYVLSQPTFVDRWSERDRTYTVKVRANVGGVEQPLQTTVMVVARPAPMPT